jgi:hypothetical protein
MAGTCGIEIAHFMSMRVVLTRKLAECIDGVDLTGHIVGDVLDLPFAAARLLIAENGPWMNDGLGRDEFGSADSRFWYTSE